MNEVRYKLVRVGQVATPPTADGERFTIADLEAAMRKVTPTLLVVGIATGAAFAIGGAIVSRYLFRERR